MWLTLDQYLDKINKDSNKYFDLSEHILELTPDCLPVDLENLFQNDNKIYKFEIGFGNGDSLIQLAQKNPHINYFGIDRKMDRARITLSKLKKRERIPNLVIARVGTDYLLDMFNCEVFDEIIMNFPDPWPKKKHHKNRTVNREFLTILHRLLKKDGVFRFTSDHAEYSFQVIHLFNTSDLFENCYTPAHYKSHVENRIPTQFEKHKKKEGFEIHYTKYRKIETGKK